MVNALISALGLDETGEPLCMLFTNTVGSRLASEPVERVSTPEDLGKWLVKHRLIQGGARLDEAYRVRALQLREAIYHLLSAIAAQLSPAAEDIETLNAECCEALAKIELTDELAWSLGEGSETERALMLIALSAAALLTSPLANRIRECAGETCGWVFMDHSKNRSRRWCSMSDCGNIAKARRFQQRKRAR